MPRSKILKISQLPPETGDMPRKIQLYLSYMEFIAPKEAKREPARLMKMLARYPHGKTLTELLSLFYPDYADSSYSRQMSLRLRLEKNIQRARYNLSRFGVTVYFCREKKKYFIHTLQKEHLENFIMEKVFQ